MIEQELLTQAPQGEPVASYQVVGWEWRWFDESPYTVTSETWSEWKRVEPRNALQTLEEAVNEFQSYIDEGYRYQLRAIYTAAPTHPAGTPATVANLARDIHSAVLRRRDGAPTQPAPQPLTDDEKLMKAEMLLNQLIEQDLERAERFMESQLAQLELRRRLAAHGITTSKDQT